MYSEGLLAVVFVDTVLLAINSRSEDQGFAFYFLGKCCVRVLYFVPQLAMRFTVDRARAHPLESHRARTWLQLEHLRRIRSHLRLTVVILMHTDSSLGLAANFRRR